MAGSGRVGVRAVGGDFALFACRPAYNAVSAVGSIVIARLLLGCLALPITAS